MPDAGEPSPLSDTAPSGVLVRRVDISVPGRLWGTKTIISHLITTKECTYKVVGATPPRVEWRGTVLFINRQPASFFPSFEEAVVDMPLEAAAPADATLGSDAVAPAKAAFAAAAEVIVAAEATKPAAAPANLEGRSHRLATEEIVADEVAEESQQAQPADVSAGGGTVAIGSSSGTRRGSGGLFTQPMLAWVAMKLAVAAVILVKRQRQRRR